MASYDLSKTTYIRGRQCTKSLYIAARRLIPRPPSDLARQAILDRGTRVGELAQQLFPGGVDMRPAVPLDFTPSIEGTRKAIAQGARVIYEASFVHDGVFAALDILVREGEGWHAYEVKSSAHVKAYHVQDAALQAYILESCGVPLTDISIVHMNTAYVRQGALDLPRLFAITSVRDEVYEDLPKVPARIAAFKAVLAGDAIPGVDIGPHCDDPFACDFKAHCWVDVPQSGSVLSLVRASGREWRLYRGGIRHLTDIPDDEPLNAAQRAQVDGWKHNRSIIDRAALADWIGTLRYPLHFLDFETFAAPVPLYDASRPYQPIPFQYSLHVQQEHNAEATHDFFLGDGLGDPRDALMQQLSRTIGPDGDIVSYHASFERSRLSEIARDLPQHAQAAEAIRARIKDLELPFLRRWYYVPALDGRTSIKVVLPALVPGRSYEHEFVKDGNDASYWYSQLVSGEFTGDAATLREQLLSYCALDTRAMVEVLTALTHAVDAD